MLDLVMPTSTWGKSDVGGLGLRLDRSKLVEGGENPLLVIL